MHPPDQLPSPGPRRPSRPHGRDELESAIFTYVLENGVADLSLRPLATSLGLSTYALVYHFHSKDALVARILARTEAEVQEDILAWMAEPGATLIAVLRRFWAWWSVRETSSLTRLFYEFYGLALQQPDRYPGFLDRAGTGAWVGHMAALGEREGAPPGHAQVAATLAVSGLTGLQIDLLTTGDIERTTRAFDALLAAIERELSER